MKTKCKKVNSLGFRIREKRENLKISRRLLAEKLNIAQSSLQAWENDEREISVSSLVSLANLLDTSIDYLIYGKNNLTEQPQEKTKISNNSIPLYNTVYASAGVGFENYDEEHVEELSLNPKFINNKNIKNLIAIYTDGDSMSPIINSGDIIILDKTQTSISDGKIFVIRVGKELFVKRIQRIIDGIKLISENKDYQDMIIQNNDLENISIIGCVIQSIHWF